jgi:hypothetical protein
MPAYKPILTKGNESELSNIYENGKLRFTLDTRRIFLDIVGGRLEFTDFVKDKTEQQILSTLAPLPKVYIASDTKKFYAYDSVTSNWIVLNDRVAHAVNADTATYAKNAGTALYAETAVSTSTATNADSATYAKNAGTATRATNATNADTATYAKNAGTATYATNSGTSAYGTKSGTATYATSAGTANFASAPVDNSDWDFGDIDDLD